MKIKPMSKTIKQIADELGVSKQAVHQKRKSKSLSTALQPFTSTVDGVIYISVDGENILKQAFDKKHSKQVDDNKSSTVDSCVDDNIYSILKETIDNLKQQLEIKDKQITELQKLLDQQQQLQFNQQKSIPVMTEKLSLWNKIFKKKNR